MVRLFKHCIPHTALLLGLFDLMCLAVAAGLGWGLRATQLGLVSGSTADRSWRIAGFLAAMLVVMISLGIYGAKRLRQLEERRHALHAKKYTPFHSLLSLLHTLRVVLWREGTR